MQSPVEAALVSQEAKAVATHHGPDEDNTDRRDAQWEVGRITVSVRVRPLNSRETKLGTGSCIAALPGYNTIYICPSSETVQNFSSLLAQDPQLRGVQHHRFTFDHVYPTDATQDEVYEQIGRPVLHSSFRGYHTCIFAYGQTGTGKSYCMMGADGGRAIEESPGIIPRLCREMFAEMQARQTTASEKGDQVEFSVYVSYLEIYRERVRSLLDEVSDAKVVAATAAGTSVAPSSTPLSARGTSLRRAAGAGLHASDNAEGTLRVREHPTLGVYVEGLAEIPVTGVDQVLRLMVRGNHRRHTASTRMNDTSSRSHAIFTIQLMQRRTHALSSEAEQNGETGRPPGEQEARARVTAAVTNGGSREIVAAAADMAAAIAESTAATATTQLGAKINLVDLAGSERVKATGAEGDTLKEGAQINKSLTTLGIVINALAAQSTATSASSVTLKTGGAKRHIPYRDSTLTFLLKESLGGNSKTFMIATVSPSSDNYDESMSTLRYADRAKAIVMKAFVNETAGDKRIRELEEEVTRLRERIQALLDAEAMRASSMNLEGGSPALLLSPSQPVAPPDPVVLADSESLPLPITAAADEEGSETGGVQGLARSSSDPDASHATDLDGDAASSSSADASSPPASPQKPTADPPREVLVNTLQSELHRAEEMIRQMTVTQAERDAHIARLVQQHEEERAAIRAATEAAAATARQEAERKAAAAAAMAAVTAANVVSPTTSTMRLNRDEPYLLNMDGAGDWVLAHLGRRRTLVGVFGPPGSRRSREAGSEETTEAARDIAAASGSSAASYDSSLSLSSEGAEPLAADVAGDEGSGGEDPDTTYVKLPQAFSDGVGGPHFVLERSALLSSGFTGSSAPPADVTLRGCDSFETYVIRPLCPAPFAVRGSAETLALQSGDVLDIGAEHIQFKYMDPAAPPVTARGRRTVALSVRSPGSGTASGGVGAWPVGGGSGVATSPATTTPTTQGPPAETQQQPAVRPSPSPTASAPHNSSETEDEGDLDSIDSEEPDPRDDGDDTSSTEADEETQQDMPCMPSQVQLPGLPMISSGMGLARPLIPALALGRVLPAAPAHHHACSPAVNAPAQEVHAGTPTTTNSPSESLSHIDDGDDTSSAVHSSDQSVTNNNTTMSPTSIRHEDPTRSLTFSETPSRTNPVAAFKSRMASKRAAADAGAHAASLQPNTALSQSELRSMRSSATSGTYRSELPPRFVGRYNVVLLGPSGGGKSLMVQNLAKPDAQWLRSALSAFTWSARGSGGRGRDAAVDELQPTIGIHSKALTTTEPIRVTLQVHELGGTPCFSPLIDQLPSHRVVYLLCFPLHGLTSLMTLRGTVEDILCRTDSHTVSIVLVGTHADRNASGKEDGSFFSRLSAARQEALQSQLEEVEQQVVSLIQMLQPYPQLRPTVVGRFAIDNVHRHVYAFGYRAVETFPQWLQWLADLARDRCKADSDFANGLIPARCVELARQVWLLRSHGKWCVSLHDFKALAGVVSLQYNSSGSPYGRTESFDSTHSPAASSVLRDSLSSHVQLLADWGLLMHRFRSAQLRQHVVLDVMWLSRVVTTLACCPLVAAAESDGLSNDEAAVLVDVVGEQGAISLTRKEAALRTLLTPQAEQVVDVVKVATTDTPHLLRHGVLSLPVLIALLEPHFQTASYSHQPGGSGSNEARPRGVAVGRTMDNTRGSGSGSGNASLSIDDGGRPDGVALPEVDAACRPRYAVPLAGAVELLVLLDLIIVGKKLLMSPASEKSSAASTRASAPAADGAGTANCNATSHPPLQEEKSAEHRSASNNDDGDEETAEVERESFVLYPLSFRTPASAGVTWLFPCFLSGPFYVFKLDMVPRNLFPKLLCRLATVADKVYFGPVNEKPWGGSTQRWVREPGRSLATTVGPFDAFFDHRAGRPYLLPSFSPYLTSTAADGRPRRRDGFWSDAAWLVYRGGGGDGEEEDSAADECRVLVRLVHHSVFLSFHCHSVAASDAGRNHNGGHGMASLGVQDFYEAVLEAVRHVVEEFPGGKCVESMQCCVDAATLLQSEVQHPAVQTDREAALMDRHLRFASISDNINNLERVLLKSGAALQTARTARRSHTGPPGSPDGRDDENGGDDAAAFVPLLRNFRDTPPLSIHDCIRRWKSEQRLYIAPEVEAQLGTALYELEECYHSPAAAAQGNSCVKLDQLLDKLARVDTA